MSATLAPPLTSTSPRIQPRPDAPASTAYARRWYTLGVLCLSLLVIVVDSTIVNVALPTFARELHASASGLQWIVDAYTLTFAALLLLAGTIRSRYGQAPRAGRRARRASPPDRWPAAFTHTTAELIAARAVMGIGGAFIMPATLSIITGVFTDPAERTKAIGLWSAVDGPRGERDRRQHLERARRAQQAVRVLGRQDLAGSRVGDHVR